MDRETDLTHLVERLISTAYPVLATSTIEIMWKGLSSFAIISWTRDFEDIVIKCSRETQKWHEAALTGLLAHELSHPAQLRKRQSEHSTDLDAIERGFGLYLAVERVYAGKYEDHIICRGKDRYLGYRSIRELLNETEIIHLDTLLSQLRLIPSRIPKQKHLQHDIVLVHSTDHTSITVDGYLFTVDRIEDESIVRTLTRDNTTYVMVNDIEIGKI